MLLKKESLGDPVFSFSNKIIRILWAFTYNVLFKFSPTPFFEYRSYILRMFGAKIGKGTAIYPTVKIWLPSNLIVEDGVAIAPEVKVYNQGLIVIKNKAIISQGTHLCASTHDYNNPLHPLILGPISIGSNVWLCADVFVGPSVTISDGTVVGARSVVYKDLEGWSVYAGNPANKIKQRKRFD